MDTVGFIMAFEAGDCDEQETIEGFQALIDSGVVWQLQGSYGRMAARLIEAGYCSPRVCACGVCPECDERRVNALGRSV